VDEALGIDFEKRLLAAAVFELRVLLANHLDPEKRGPEAAAACLAYALHNQALAVLEGRPFDVALALDGLARLEPMLGAAQVQQFRELVPKAG